MSEHDELPAMLKAAKANQDVPHKVVVFIAPADVFTDKSEDAKSREVWDWCVENLDKRGDEYVFSMIRPFDEIHYIVTGETMPFVFSFRYDDHAVAFKLAWHELLV